MLCKQYGYGEFVLTFVPAAGVVAVELLYFFFLSFFSFILGVL